MFRTTLAAAALLSCLAAPAWADPASPMVQVFAQGAGLSNAFEIAEANLALQNSTDPAVRDFAARMIHDHTMAQRELRRAAAYSGSTADFMLDAGHQKMIDDLSDKTGPAFDAAYLADQRAAHMTALEDLNTYAASGEDPALRDWAMMTAPTVAMHMRMLDDMTAQ